MALDNLLFVDRIQERPVRAPVSVDAVVEGSTGKYIESYIQRVAFSILSLINMKVCWAVKRAFLWCWQSPPFRFTGEPYAIDAE